MFWSLWSPQCLWPLCNIQWWSIHLFNPVTFSAKLYQISFRKLTFKHALVIPFMFFNLIFLLLISSSSLSPYHKLYLIFQYIRFALSMKRVSLGSITYLVQHLISLPQKHMEKQNAPESQFDSLVVILFQGGEKQIGSIYKLSQIVLSSSCSQWNMRIY